MSSSSSSKPGEEGAQEKQNQSGKVEVEEDFDWLQLRRELDRSREGDVFPDKETGMDKFRRKFKENPLIPIGKSKVFKGSFTLRDETM